MDVIHAVSRLVGKTPLSNILITLIAIVDAISCSKDFSNCVLRRSMSGADFIFRDFIVVFISFLSVGYKYEYIHCGFELPNFIWFSQFYFYFYLNDVYECLFTWMIFRNRCPIECKRGKVEDRHLQMW